MNGMMVDRQEIKLIRDIDVKEGSSLRPYLLSAIIVVFLPLKTQTKCWIFIKLSS